jgi:hypothetical protein
MVAPTLRIARIGSMSGHILTALTNRYSTNGDLLIMITLYVADQVLL